MTAAGEPQLLVAGTSQSSAVDGPGNRYVLFLQGCNFDCGACHNPSTIGRGDDADPTARTMSVGDQIDEIRPLAPFLSGITVTGGEPTLQLNGLTALFTAIKTDDELGGLTTLVDPNGTLSRRGWEQILPVLDGAMVDLKAANRDLHRSLTGAGNDRVKESITLLAGAGKLAEVRLLVVAGVTDTEAELTEWAGFVRGLDPDIPVRLMAFRHAGARQEARQWDETSPEALNLVHDRLIGLGLTNVFAPRLTAGSVAP